MRKRLATRENHSQDVSIAYAAQRLGMRPFISGRCGMHTRLQFVWPATSPAPPGVSLLCRQPVVERSALACLAGVGYESRTFLLAMHVTVSVEMAALCWSRPRGSAARASIVQECLASQALAINVLF